MDQLDINSLCFGIGFELVHHNENIYFMNNSFEQKENSVSDASDLLSLKAPKRENGKSKMEALNPFFQTQQPLEQITNGNRKKDDAILKTFTTKPHDQLNIQLIS